MKERTIMRMLTLALLGLLSTSVLAQNKVVVYVSMDEEHSRKVLNAFQEVTGIQTVPVFDTEDNKTVGLTNRIIASRKNPTCDVFWNNEAGQTVRLKNLGILEPYVSPNAATIPAGFKDADGTWTGFAARARVLIYNTDLMKKEDLPARLEDLVDPRFKGQCAMSKPLTGTGLTHAAALYAHWGPERGEKFYRELIKNGVRWERGNAQVMREVSKGTRPFGMTDTDDARVAVLRGAHTDIIYLDQEEGGLGTLVIPNTAMIIKGGPNPAEARKLIDFLLSPTSEKMLAEGDSAQIPLHAGATAPAHVTSLDGLRAMKNDFAKVGAMIEAHGGELEVLFTSAVAGQDASAGDGAMSLLWAVGALALILILVWWFMRGTRFVA